MGARETRGELIRRYRELRGYTQTELGAMTSMDQGSVSEIEKGNREAGAELMSRFVNVLEIPTGELAGAYTNEVGNSQAAGARNRAVMRPTETRKKKK